MTGRQIDWLASLTFCLTFFNKQEDRRKKTPLSAWFQIQSDLPHGGNVNCSEARSCLSRGLCAFLFPFSPSIIPTPISGSPFELIPHWERGNPALVPLALGVPRAAGLGCVAWQDACSLATDTRKHAPTDCLANGQPPLPPALHTLTSGLLAAAGLLLTKSLKADGWMLCSWWKSWLPPLQPSQIFPIGSN